MAQKALHKRASIPTNQVGSIDNKQLLPQLKSTSILPKQTSPQHSREYMIGQQPEEYDSSDFKQVPLGSGNE